MKKYVRIDLLENLDFILGIPIVFGSYSRIFESTNLRFGSIGMSGIRIFESSDNWHTYFIYLNTHNNLDVFMVKSDV